MTKKVLTLIAVNLLILFMLLIVINFVLVLIAETEQVIKRFGGFADERAKAPNYANIGWAKKHFEEYNSSPSEYRSYIGWRRLPFKGETVHIDEQGIRMTPQHRSATERSPLVAFLGGSTMWGIGSDDSTTIPAFFSEIAQGRYRTLNLGETGYRAFQSSLFLSLQMNDGLRPDIVVSYDGVNEKAGFQPELTPRSHYREVQIREVTKGLDTRSLLRMRDFLLGPLETVIAYVKRNIKRRTGSKEYDLSQERTERVAKALLDSWLSTQAVSEKNGAYFLAVLQPNAGVGKPNLKHLKIKPQEIIPYPYLYPAVLKMLERPEYKELSGHFLDLRQFYSEVQHLG